VTNKINNCAPSPEKNCKLHAEKAKFAAFCYKFVHFVLFINNCKMARCLCAFMCYNIHNGQLLYMILSRDKHIA